VTDVLIVSLASTGGLRTADDALALALSRAGAEVRVAVAQRPREVRTLALTDLVWARAARRAAVDAIARYQPRAIVYSSVGSALLWPRPGAIRFDAPASGNRPGRHGVWQRPVERRRLAAAPLLLPWSDAGLAEAPPVATEAVVVPVPIAATPPAEVRDVAAITYGANPDKKGLDRVLAAWRDARHPGEELVVAGVDGPAQEGVRYAGVLPAAEYRTLLAHARVFVTAPRREDYGLAQLEALADGCVLVTTPAPGPYAALPLARTLDPRTVSDDLAAALRVALDDPSPGYAARARTLLAPYDATAVDAIVRERVLPALLAQPIEAQP
jgi:glycosyl transferase family 1